MTKGRKWLGATALGVMLAAGAAAHAADKTIVWGKPAEITGFDVHVAGTVTDWEMYEMVYETLLTTDENLKLQPGLATSWEQTSPTSYVFKLRPDAKFSNGRAVTAEDVAGSLQRIEDPKTVSYWSAQLGTISKIETPDEHTVKVELKTPHPAFLAALAHISAAIIPIKELKAGTFDPTKDFLGSGPFMAKSHKQDESWSLVRNPNYWGKNLPVADRLEAPIIPDDSARMAALRDGRIDFTTFENPDIAHTLSTIPNISVLPQKTTNYFRIDVNALNAKSPFHDKRVRQAMNLALDRDAINNLVFAGTTSVDYPVPAAFGKSACKSTPTYAWPRDKRLEKAKALLKDAGMEHPHVTLLASSTDPVFGMIAQVAQQSLAEAGFDVQIQQPTMADYLKKVFTDGDFDFAISWLAGYTDPSMVIAWWNPNFAVWNKTFQQDVPALDKTLDEIKAMQDGPERDAKLDEACKLIDDGANLVALVSKVDYVAYRSDRVKVKIAPRTGSSNTFQYIADFAPLH
ncbi:MAG TPA: ABC transporter substrate-binding protein [Roseiarcus sp.]|jgi:peptide/nickel transport system substrate-binding protein